MAPRRPRRDSTGLAFFWTPPGSGSRSSSTQRSSRRWHPQRLSPPSSPTDAPFLRPLSQLGESGNARREERRPAVVAPKGVSGGGILQMLRCEVWIGITQDLHRAQPSATRHEAGKHEIARPLARLFRPLLRGWASQLLTPPEKTDMPLAAGGICSYVP